MIKIASRKIFPSLPHASMLIDVDIYLNVGSTCKTVLVLSRNLAMCSVAIEVIFFPHWWDRILNKHNVTEGGGEIVYQAGEAGIRHLYGRGSRRQLLVRISLAQEADRKRVETKRGLDAPTPTQSDPLPPACSHLPVVPQVSQRTPPSWGSSVADIEPNT